MTRFAKKCHRDITVQLMSVSVTEFTLLQRRELFSLLALRPITGRTHQLRVHCAHMGFPILGDPQYGNDESRQLSETLGLHTQALCAKELSFTHPVTNTPMHLQSKLDVLSL